MKQALLLQILAALLMVAPLVVFSVPLFTGNSDALFYTIILRLVSDHMIIGDIRPLWLPEANGGTGSPVMLYYSPLAYQITALLGLPISFFDPLGWKRMLLGMCVAQCIGGVAAYVWLHRMVRPGAAMAGSLLYTIFPYKFVYIFLHANLAQLWALAWLPLLMIAADDITHGKPRGMLKYAIWLALLALTHPRTLVAFALVPALYAFVFAHRSRLSALFSLIGAHILAVSLAAFYLLPAFLNLDLVHHELANTGRFNYAANLGHKDVALNFHYAVIIALLLGLMLRVPTLRRSATGRMTWFYILITVVAAVLCLRITQPLWDALPLLQFLQFPAARLHAVALIAATALAAIFLQYYEKAREPQWLYSPLAIVLPVAIMMGITLNHINDIYRKGEGITESYIRHMHELNIILPPEYMTRWQPDEANMPTHVESIASLPLADAQQELATVDATFTGSRSIRLVAGSELGASDINVRQLYLPQWTVGGSGIDSDENGLMTLPLPSGEHTLTLGAFSGEYEGLVISLVALACTVFWLLQPRRRKKWPDYSHH